MFARELLCECVQEAMPLLVKHHCEVMGDKYPLDPRWEEYALLERLGRYVVFTMRDEGNLIGYSAFYVDRHMHSKAFTHAVNDVFYVERFRRDARVLGFLRYCMKQLRAEGAKHIEFECADKNALGLILHEIGFQYGGRRLGINI